jgi:3',5'-cyclic AMP phosphodiesterase CpdA
MPQSLTLAHLSDVHLAPLPLPRLRDVSMKRALGLANWLRKRRFIHDRRVLDRIVADMLAEAPDHIAVTGDLTNIGLPSEFEQALEWLKALGPPDRVTVIPGNHDHYVHLFTDLGTDRWAPYMAGDNQWTGAAHFPFVRVRGPVALIGLNTGVPTPPLVAAGWLGLKHRAALTEVLRETRAQGLVRVVLIHHPPLPGLALPIRGLADASPLRDLLVAEGAEVVLYGHNHVSRVDRLDTAAGPCAVIGVASASASRAYHEAPPARYNLLRFEARGDGATRITLTTRGYEPEGGRIVEIGRADLAPAPIPQPTLPQG